MIRIGSGDPMSFISSLAQFDPAIRNGDSMKATRNRVKRLEQRSRMFWCWGCDHNHVNSGGKCDLYGCKDARKRYKKPTIQPDF